MAITQPFMSMTEPGVIEGETKVFSNNNFSGLPNSCVLQLYANGGYFASSDFTFSPKWVSPAEYADTLYVRVTRDSGTSLGFSGTLNTWQLMNTARVWQYTNSANNQTLSGFYTAEFSPNSNGTPVIGTFPFSLQAVTGLGS